MNGAAPERYEWTGPTGVHFVQLRSPEGTYFHQETPPEVRRILDDAIRSGHRLRIFTGDTKTGRCWNEEYDTIGQIGRSMGPVKVPLLIATARSTGGHAILDAHIVAIQTAPGRFAYRHPGFSVGTWTTGDPGPLHQSAAYCDGELHARFHKPDAAERYCAFMRGDRWAK